MSADVETTIRIDAQFAETARFALDEAFDATFDIWVNGGAWYPLSADGTVNAAPDHVADAALAELLDRVVVEEVVAISLADSTVRLAIRLPQRARTPLVGVSEFKGVDSAFLKRFGVLFQREFNQRAEVLALRHENQAFLRQVTNDFEELTFLRSMAELLEITDLSFDFVAMAETVLPTLKPLLEADELVLVGAQAVGNGAAVHYEVGSVTVRAGKQVVDDHVCHRLVKAFRDRCELQPVVKNYFHDTPEGGDFPGVESFIVVPIVNGEQVIGWLVALNRNNERNINTEELPWEVSYLEFGTHEATLMSSSAAILATHCRNVELFREREELLVSMVRALVSAIEAKDEYTRGHSERVALYGKRLAEELGLSDDYCQRLYLTGLLHDVGKIGVRDAVLRKPGPLTDEEFEEIKEHPDKGWAILQDLNPLSYVLPGVLHHHENFDGRGYPDNLAADDIPLDGRILAVADAYDAMTSDRPYRTGMPHKKAEAILRGGAGEQWDPEAIDAFFRAMPDILHIKETYRLRTPPQRKEPQLV